MKASRLMLICSVLCRDRVDGAQIAVDHSTAGDPLRWSPSQRAAPADRLAPYRVGKTSGTGASDTAGGDSVATGSGRRGRSSTSPMPTMMRNDQKTMVEFGRSSFGKSFSAGTCLSRLWVRIRLPRAGIQARICALFHIRQTKQQQRGGFPADFPSAPRWRRFWQADVQACSGHAYPRLRPEWVRPAVPSTWPSRTFCEWRACRCRAAGAEPRRAHKQGAAQERGDGHVNQPVRERGVEDDGQPVFRDHLTVLNGEALRSVHPAVRGEDPEGGH